MDPEQEVPQQPPTVGRPYAFGKALKWFKGGNPMLAASWSDTPIAAPEEVYTPPPMGSAVREDRITMSPEQARRTAPALLGAASLMIPGMGKAANIAVQGAVGAGIGALGAPSGERMSAAKKMGAIGLIGGATMEGGLGLLGMMKRPGNILALKNVVPGVRNQIGTQLANANEFFSGKEKDLAELTATRTANVNEKADAMATSATSNADRLAAQQAETQGPRVAGRVREISGIPNKIDEAMAQADEGKQSVRDLIYSEIEKDHPEITHAPLLAYLKTPELRSATRTIAPQVLNGEGVTFQQFQEIWNRFAGGKFGDPAVKTRLSQLGQAGVGERLATADQYYAGFSAFQREAERAQKAGAWPASRLRRTISRLPTETAKMGFREGQVADMVQKLQQTDAGTPYIKKLLDGGDEMDERLRTIFPKNEDFAAIKSAIAEERATLADLTKNRDIAVAKVGNQRSGLLADIAEQNDQSLLGLGAERRAETSRLGLLDQRAASLEERRAAEQASSERIAKLIRDLALTGTIAATMGMSSYALYRGMQAVTK